MKLRPFPHGFTLVEMIISMAASVVVLGALLLSSISMQKALNGSQKYAMAYSDQRRVLDYVGRDLRRAVGVSATDAGGSVYPVKDTTVTIVDRQSLILTLPGYYRSNTKYTADFDQPLDVVGTEDRLDYGDATTGLAATVEVNYRRVFLAKEGVICFVRQEAGTDDVIVRGADNLNVQVTVQSGTQAGAIKAWYRAPYSGVAPLVTTFDRLLLRNPPLDLHP